jgi:hypothetical protein
VQNSKLTYNKLLGDIDGEYHSSSFGYSYNDVESVYASRVGKVEIGHINHHGSRQFATNFTNLMLLQPFFK